MRIKDLIEQLSTYEENSEVIIYDDDNDREYEIVSIDDESISHKIGAYSGMSVVVLRKALQSIVQFGYSQIEIERELLEKIIVQPV